MPHFVLFLSYRRTPFSQCPKGWLNVSIPTHIWEQYFQRTRIVPPIRPRRNTDTIIHYITLLSLARPSFTRHTFSTSSQ
jgi:hypothetical protein